jgi:hypothetical protein
VKRDRSPPHTKNDLAKWVPPLCSNSSFFVVSCLPFHFQTLLFCLCLAYFVSPCVMRPNRPGPWALDKVKKRLRAEQVQRERLASERYRQEENQGQEQEAKTIQTVSTQSPLLLFLGFACLLLLLLVLVLSSVVVALGKK